MGLCYEPASNQLLVVDNADNRIRAIDLNASPPTITT